MSHMSAAGQAASTGHLHPGPGRGDRERGPVHAPSRPATPRSAGWPRRAASPLGYLGDADKTARTFPVIDGIRYSVPGDRARLTADGVIELYGRDSVTINSGGEKIFAEEVEQAIAHHPDVYDVVVRRPAERAVGPGGRGRRAAARGRHRRRGGPARRGRPPTSPAYKLPKSFVFVPEIVRSPAGKADYRWAKEQAAAEPTSPNASR